MLFCITNKIPAIFGVGLWLYTAGSRYLKHCCLEVSSYIKEYSVDTFSVIFTFQLLLSRIIGTYM